MTTKIADAVLLEQAALERMLADNTPDPKPGRPRTVLYPKIAEQALKELAVGRSYRVVARRCGVSPPWLWSAHRSGGLNEMAEGRMGQPTGPQILPLKNAV